MCMPACPTTNHLVQNPTQHKNLILNNFIPGGRSVDAWKNSQINFIDCGGSVQNHCGGDELPRINLSKRVRGALRIVSGGVSMGSE